MAKLAYGLNQSLDGYVDHREFRPSPALFRHFIEHVRGLTGMVYGRRMYEVMRYWDEDLADWDAEEHDFAAAWRSQPKSSTQGRADTIVSQLSRCWMHGSFGTGVSGRTK
jgi:hypothetical protein